MRVQTLTIERLTQERDQLKQQLAQVQVASKLQVELAWEQAKEAGWLSPDEAKAKDDAYASSVKVIRFDFLNKIAEMADEAKRLEMCVSICETKNEELIQQQKRLEAQLHDASTFGKNEESPASSTTLPKLRRCCVKQCNSPLRICMSVQTIGANAATPSSRNKRTRCELQTLQGLRSAPVEKGGSWVSGSSCRWAKAMIFES